MNQPLKGPNHRRFIFTGMTGITALILLIFLSHSASAQENETAFVSLVPGGGAVWDDILSTHLAVHPTLNRLYTVARAADGYRLVHRDSVTAGVVASTTTDAQPGWVPLDLEVWGAGNQVLVAWGRSVSSERSAPLAFERIDVNTGFTFGATTAVSFLAFDVDQIHDKAHGLTTSATSTNYIISSLNLSSGNTLIHSLPVAVTEAIARDAVIDPTREVFYALFQPTKPGSPNLVSLGGFLIGMDLNTGAIKGRVDLPTGNYRLGGLALDDLRQAAYTVPFDGGPIHRIDVANFILSATILESQVAPNYMTAGSGAVHRPTGQLFVANNNEPDLNRRIILLDVENATGVRSWSSGADPSRLVYDARLGWAFAASQPSQSVTALDASREHSLFETPMAILPWDLVYDASRERLLLLSEGGDIFAIDARSRRLVDKLNSIGYRPAVRLHLDPPRGRFMTGTYAQAEPAVYDSGGLTRLGTLPRSGGALALAPQEGLLFQTGFSFLETSPIFISAATDGSLLQEIPASTVFGKTQILAVDEERHLLYGLTGRRANPRGRGIWAYNWISGATKELVIPPPPSGAWNPLLDMAVEPASGQIVLLAYESGVTPWAIVYASVNDTSPVRLSLAGVSGIHDMAIDVSRRQALVLASVSNPRASKLIEIDLASQPVARILDLNIPSLPIRMALDTVQNALWLAGSTPSGFYYIPRPASLHSKKTSGSVIDLQAEPRPGKVRLTWLAHPPPSPGASFILYRQDGGLAAFRPLLPLRLPGSATTFSDVNVLPGIDYQYRIELVEGAAVIRDGIGPIAVPDFGSNRIRPRLLTLVHRIPRGGSQEITLHLDGSFQSGRHAIVQFPDNTLLSSQGVHVTISGSKFPVPGFIPIRLEADSWAPAGSHAIPVIVRAGGEEDWAWFFVEVVVPFGNAEYNVLPFPELPRRIGIRTDSVLREKQDNLLIIKGSLGNLAGDEGGTGVIARVDSGDGTITEQQDIVASNGRYSISVRLPDLKADTTVKVQVTWLGSPASPGGTSPILYLPVGGYSQSAGQKTGESTGPENAFFILGNTPQNISPAPASEDLSAILDDARNTVLRDFDPSVRPESRTGPEVQNAITQSSGQIVMIYAIADTMGGKARLADGTQITPEDMAGLVDALPVEAQAIVMIEGPQSGYFTKTGVPYRPGTTVIASSGIRDQANRMTPWIQSFSSLFFEKCRSGQSLAECYNLAQVPFIEGFYGALQTPVLVPGELSGISINGRFAPAELPDTQPPEFLQVTHNLISNPSAEIEMHVTVRDDRDTASHVSVRAEVTAWDGQLMGTYILIPPAEKQGEHTGARIPAPRPVAGFRVYAVDQTGNESAPLSFQVETSGEAMAHDYNDDGQVNQNDLLALIRVHSERGLGSSAILDFSKSWMNAVEP